MPKHSLKKASRIDWVADVKEEGAYPGDKNVELGALMRIADATEAMAKDHQNMLDNLAYYKQRIERLSSDNDYLRRSNNALRGHINRMKKAAAK